MNELYFWTKALDASVVELLVAVDKVGTCAEDVRDFLDREYPIRRSVSA